MLKKLLKLFKHKYEVVSVMGNSSLGKYYTSAGAIYERDLANQFAESKGFQIRFKIIEI